MMIDFTPQARYQQQLEKWTAELAALLKKRSRLGWMRLLVFLLTVILAYQLFTSAGWLGLLPAFTGMGLLLFLVSKDVANNEKIRNAKTIIQLNEDELQALNHQFTGRENGQPFFTAEHAYANDLDLFGPASVYQWLSRCYTEQGRNRLAGNLLQPLSLPVVQLRQDAVKELTQSLAWRQQWQAFAMQNVLTIATEQKMESWLQEDEKQFTNGAWKTLVIGYSTLTLGTAIAAILGYIPPAMFSTLYLLFLIFSLALSIKNSRSYMLLNGVVKEAATLQALVDWLESATFNAGHLQQLQSSIKAASGKAGNEIRKLKKLLDRFDVRNSIIGFLFLSPFLLWDVRQMIALNQWRRQNRPFVKKWFEAVAEMEVIHSLCTVSFNNPGWCFPQFSSMHFTLEGCAIGHPLISAQQRVTNDFLLRGTAKIALITGSNMAGKSTFLRSLGVNAVMAQMGSPVCAIRFLLSPVQVVSSMRIADNLAENTSTFYAELKKLRTIVEMVKAHLPVFVLLDEMLRGTNSFDRHKGAAALIRQMLKENAVAVIATHDVELAQLTETAPQAIANYHFDVEIEGEELYFDYKLKLGICKSLNASLLMKKIGIDLE